MSKIAGDNIKWLIGSTLILFLLGCSSESSRKDRIEVDASKYPRKNWLRGFRRRQILLLTLSIETAMIRSVQELNTTRSC